MKEVTLIPEKLSWRFPNKFFQEESERNNEAKKEPPPKKKTRSTLALARFLHQSLKALALGRPELLGTDDTEALLSCDVDVKGATSLRPPVFGSATKFAVYVTTSSTGQMDWPLVNQKFSPEMATTCLHAVERGKRKGNLQKWNLQRWNLAISWNRKWATATIQAHAFGRRGRIGLRARPNSESRPDADKLRLSQRAPKVLRSSGRNLLQLDTQPFHVLILFQGPGMCWKGFQDCSGIKT